MTIEKGALHYYQKLELRKTRQRNPEAVRRSLWLRRMFTDNRDHS
jgi:hypothetical protein